MRVVYRYEEESDAPVVDEDGQEVHPIVLDGHTEVPAARVPAYGGSSEW